MQCLICSSLDLHAFVKFTDLKRVTSDAKPWPAGGKLAICRHCGTVQKNADQDWLAEIAFIYSNYEIYHQSQGEEQAVFTYDGMPSKRSAVLTQFLHQANFLTQQHGSILDYGCGNGEFLAALSRHYPEYDLFGFDLSDRYQAQLQAIPGFKTLYQPQSGPDQKFDLMILSHTLEHLLNPIETLTIIRGYLKEGGGLFIQVPNIKESPFDILIADHLLHFSAENLHNILTMAGFTVVCCETNIVAKEISLFAVPNVDAVSEGLITIDWQELRNLIDQYIATDFQLIADTEQMQARGEFGIFGTSISATWLYGYFADVSFFLDEDPNRIGNTHFNKPIYHPQKVYGKNTPVSIPISPAIAERIIDRHFQRKSGFIIPKNQPIKACKIL